ncbi:MAG: HAD family hydrolase [Butyrivibrio sp.]|nr:HAD family hydrolase [Butyrivibrio sp.]
MKNKISEYKLIIVDMDGTLYYQTPLRLYMLKKLILHIIKNNIKGLREVLLVSEFRKLRENSALTVEEACNSLSKSKNLSFDYISGVINKWIMEEPLNGLVRFKDDILCDILNTCNNKNSIVTIFSDYPAEDKCKALNISFPSYHANQEEINALKPSPKGIKYIMKLNNITDSSSVLMIGDRESRDGKSADAAGCDKLILPKSKRERKAIYSTLL